MFKRKIPTEVIKPPQPSNLGRRILIAPGKSFSLHKAHSRGSEVFRLSWPTQVDAPNAIQAMQAAAKIAEKKFVRGLMVGLEGKASRTDVDNTIAKVRSEPSAVGAVALWRKGVELGWKNLPDGNAQATIAMGTPSPVSRQAVELFLSETADLPLGNCIEEILDIVAMSKPNIRR